MRKSNKGVGIFICQIIDRGFADTLGNSCTHSCHWMGLELERGTLEVLEQRSPRTLNRPCGMLPAARAVRGPSPVQYVKILPDLFMIRRRSAMAILVRIAPSTSHVGFFYIPSPTLNEVQAPGLAVSLVPGVGSSA